MSKQLKDLLLDEHPEEDDDDKIENEDELSEYYRDADRIGAEELKTEINNIRRRYNRQSAILGLVMLIMFAIMVVLIVLTIMRIQYTKRVQAQLDEWQNVEKSQNFETTLKKLDGIHNYLSTYFLFDEDNKKISNELYHALLKGYDDPYTVYYDEEEYKKLQQSSGATYTGIGVTVALDEESGYIEVVNVFDEGGAKEAGLCEGDFITAIEGVDIKGNAMDDSVVLMKGDEGSTVTVTVYRPDEDRSFDAVIVRKKIDIISVDGMMIDDNVGYIAISQFGNATAKQFKKTYEELDSEGMKALMIDVRDNPGGQLDSVNEILDYLLPEGIIVYTEDKNGNRKDYNSDASCKKLPIVVLTNEKSASASEIFAGALKDYNWATLVGTKTYGKGIVQVIHSLNDGTALKITVARYFTPLGTCIHGIGVEPNVEVEYILDESKDDWTADPQAFKGYQLLLEEI